MMLRALVGMLGAVFFHGCAVAQDIAPKAQEAEALAGQGMFVEAIAALDEAVAALWDRAPLTMRRALWVTETPSGFGAYKPRENNVFAPGAAMIASITLIAILMTILIQAPTTEWLGRKLGLLDEE